MFSKNLMKYYFYISKNKVEMLYAQVPNGFLSRLGAEAKFNVKVVSVSVKSEPQMSNLYRDTNIVSRYIEKQKKITGTLGNPKSYVHGITLLETMFIEQTKRKSVIWTGGGIPEHNIILGGSLSNVIGYEKVEGLEKMNHSSSDLLGIDQVLELVEVYENDGNKKNSKVSATSKTFLPKVKSAQLWPERRYEFLAKVLNENEIGGIPSTIIASPIYMALL